MLRLKEHYTQCARERDNYAEENRRLKTLLAKHGINIPGDLFDPTSSSGSFSGSYPNPSTNTSVSPPPHSANSTMASQMQQRMAPPAQQVNYEQAGIDFVLSYDAPYLTPPPGH